MALIGGERGEKALRRMFSRMCMTYYLWSICKASQGGETNFLFKKSKKKKSAHINKISRTVTRREGQSLAHA